MATDTLLGIQEGLSDKGSLYKVLTNIAGILDRSAIARHSDSPLETSLAKLQESSVSFNEKTMRWHDDQTNLMVKGTDPRVAEAMKISEEPRTVEAEIHWSGTIAGFLSDIKDDTATLIKLQKSTRKLLGRAFFGKKKESVEEGMEGNIADKNAAKNEKKQTGFLKGISDYFKKRKEESGIWKWFKDNWGKLALGLFVALAPMKWFPKIWEWLKNDLWPVLENVFKWGTKNPMKALGAMLIAWFAGPAGLAMLGGMIVGKLGKLLKGIPGFIKGIPGFFKELPSKLGTAVGTVKRWGKNVFGKEGFLQKTVPSKLGKAVGTAKRWGRQGVEGVKSFGGTMKKGVTTIASGAKFVGGKAMEVGKAVGGKAGDWFKTLMGKFGTAGKFLAKMGKSVIQGLMTMGPYGWGIIGGIALGGLVWHFWKDVTKVWDTVASSIKEGFTKIKTMVMGVFGNVQGMVGSWLRGIGAGMIADWIDPDGADKEEEKKEFTWGGFATELWNIYSGIWGKIIDFVKSINPIEIIKNVSKMIGGAAKSLWNSVFGGPDEAEAAGDDGDAGAAPDEMDIMEKELEGKAAVAGSDKSGKTETLVHGKKTKASDITTKVTGRKGATRMGQQESIEVETKSGPSSKRMLEKGAAYHLEKFRSAKPSSRKYGTKNMKGLLKGGTNRHKNPHRAAAEIWELMNEKERKKFAKYKPEGADDKAAMPAADNLSSAVIKSQQNKPDDMNSYKGEKGTWSLVGNDWIFYSDRQADETAVKIPSSSIFKTEIPTVTGLMPNEEGWDKDDDDLIEQDNATSGKIEYQTGVDVGTKEEKIQKNIIKFVQLKEKDFKKAKKKTKKIIARTVAKHLRGPHRELVLEALKGTKLEEQIKKLPGGLKGPADLSKVQGAKKMLTPSGGLNMQSKDFNSYMGAGSAKKPAEKFVPTTWEEAKKFADFPDDARDVMDTKERMDMEKKERIVKANNMSKGTLVANKLVPTNPNQQGATLTAGQQQTANLSGGSAGGNVGINTTTVNNTTLGESTMVVGQQRPVGNPKMGNLT